MLATMQTSWHTTVAEQLQVTFDGAKIAGTSEPSDWNGTYLVRLEEQSPERCLWGIELAEEFGWERLEVEAVRDADCEILVKVSLQGPLPCPTWSGLVRQLQGVHSLSWSSPRSAVIEGIDWPEKIRLRPMTGFALPHGFFLAPEPSIAELEAVVGGPPPGCDPNGNNYKACHPPRPAKLYCCDYNPCGCFNKGRCPCGFKEVDPIKVPAPNVGLCSGCTSWGCPPMNVPPDTD